MTIPIEECQGECFEVPVPWYKFCLFCKLRNKCKDEYGDLADKDSDHCRLLNYHKKELLE